MQQWIKAISSILHWRWAKGLARALIAKQAHRQETDVEGERVDLAIARAVAAAARLLYVAEGCDGGEEAVGDITAEADAR